MALFNVRVYGILIDQQHILVTDEYIRGEHITKFPGGGLEFGEGTIDCLKREFEEETGLHIQVLSHLYTTDFFQISAFNKKDQIICIYYLVNCPDKEKLRQLPTHSVPFDFTPEQKASQEEEYEIFRWISLHSFSVANVSLPIDKTVAKLIIDNKQIS